ncbi:hypothetical protein RHGRI_017197 [Rhododendron griersonianum]|uniref:Uncharacterized protein n=1 Tax=Rhododendron griersonianum TaxID=479676 RepID=A0AAV6JWV8_9ERIC|nr:hypothetical protein RHGRI_017197 [Rhododendron griersonianum]
MRCNYFTTSCIESEGNPREDPRSHALAYWRTWLVVLLFSGLVYEIGNSEVGVQPLILQLKYVGVIYSLWVISSLRFLKLTQGYVLGNPLTSQHDDVNSRLDFVHGMAILTDGLYESTKSNCDGEYVDVDPNNAACIKDLTVLVTRGYNYLLSYAWANNECVQHALHIRKFAMNPRNIYFDVVDA